MTCPKYDRDFSQLVAGYMSRTGDVAPNNNATDFVLSGLRAARSVKRSLRRNILADVARVVGCAAEELEFLYDIPVPGGPALVPDYRDVLTVEAEPITYLEAAE